MKISITVLLSILLFSSAAFGEGTHSMKTYLSKSQHLDRDLIVSSFSKPVERALDLFGKSSRLKMKMRILDMLVLFPKHKKTKIFLGRLLRNTRSPKLLPSIIIAIGEVEGESSVGKIIPYLNSEDDSIRLAAIIALGRYGGQKGGDLLAEYQEDEQNPAYRAKIRAYLN